MQDMKKLRTLSMVIFTLTMFNNSMHSQTSDLNAVTPPAALPDSNFPFPKLRIQAIF